jgi:hypothetical protein
MLEFLASGTTLLCVVMELTSVGEMPMNLPIPLPIHVKIGLEYHQSFEATRC